MVCLAAPFEAGGGGMRSIFEGRCGCNDKIIQPEVACVGEETGRELCIIGAGVASSSDDVEDRGFEMACRIGWR